MRVPVTFGQYVPVASPVHVLDAKAKMGIGIAFTVGIFLVDGLAGLVVMGAAIALVIHLSRVPWHIACRGLKALALLLCFTLLAHTLRWNATSELLIAWGPLGISAQGFVTGIFFAFRVVLLVLGTSLLTLTTTPVELTDALERIMRPLERIGFPAGEIAMMLTIALRFIPTTAQEAEKIIVAQTARGASFNEGGLIQRAHAFVPVLIPLFVNLFRRAEDLALAMESRCYQGSTRRTHLHVSRMTTREWMVLLVASALFLLIGVAL